MQDKEITSIVWFTENLRTHDNFVLHAAMNSSNKVIAVYQIDIDGFKKTKYGFKKTDKFRANFLIESLKCLKEQLETLNVPLFISSDKTLSDIRPLFKEYNIKHIFIQKEWTRNELLRFNIIKNLAGKSVEVNEIYDQFLYHPEDYPFNYNEIPEVFTRFRKIVEKKVSVRETVNCTKQNKISISNNKTKIPTLKELGFEEFKVNKKSAFPFKGGAKNALDRLENYTFTTKLIGNYKNTRNGLLGVDYSSKLSPWLSNGSLSPRQVYWKIKDFEKEFYSNQSTYWLIFELIWRDFFKYISLKHKDSIFKIGGILNKTYSWSNNIVFVKKWINGNTENDFINANMIELKNTGWMSNRGRQNVASYFSKIQKLDWRIGAAYFESLLIDYDVHSNYGNWMYLAGVGNDPRDREFNINRQADIYDKDYKFRKNWLKYE